MPNPFIPTELPLTNIAWEDLLPGIIKANIALANFNGILETIRNPLIFLSPLMVIIPFLKVCKSRVFCFLIFST